MQIGKFPGVSLLNEDQIHTLAEAFEEALRLTDTKDRTCPRAEAIVDRIITAFEIGERDPKRIARAAVEN